MLVDPERRATHDLVAGSAAVFDWGGRSATLPTPLAQWLEHHDLPTGVAISSRAPGAGSAGPAASADRRSAVYVHPAG